MANLIFSHLISASEDAHVRDLCNRTGARLSLRHHSDGRILFYFVNDGWSSPAFGSHADLRSFAAEMLSGFLRREL